MSGPAERPALAALLLGAVGIAFAPIFVRWALHWEAAGTGPTATAFWRLALAAPLLWAWSRRGPAAGRPTSWRETARVALPGLFFAADLGVWHWSILYTSVANSTLLANLAPVFVTLGGFVVFRRRFTRLFLFGMVLAIAGAALLLGASLRLGGTHVKGDALGLLTAVFYASYILAVGHLRARFSTLSLMAWSSASAAVVLLPVALLGGESMLPAAPRGWLVLAGLALVSQIGGQGLIAYALAHLPAAFSSVTLLVQPVSATLLAWVFFAEAVGGRQAVGAVIVLAGILVARRGSTPHGGGGRRSSSSSARSGVPGAGSAS